MHTVRQALIILVTSALLAGCAAVPFGIGLIPGAPAYVSTIVGQGQTAYETAMDERSTEQQILDAIIAGHAQAELYRNKEIRANQITAYCYFGRLFLVGEYDSQAQLQAIYKCMNNVENKRAVISHLYLREETSDSDFMADQLLYTEIRTQLLADFEVTSTPIQVAVIQGDIILLGVVAEQQERDKIVAHACSTHGVNRVISYLYHQDASGPTPRIMTAQLPARPTVAKAKKTAKPRPAKPRKPKRENTPKPTAVASTTPQPPLEINGRFTGL